MHNYAHINRTQMLTRSCAYVWLCIYARVVAYTLCEPFEHLSVYVYVRVLAVCAYTRVRVHISQLWFGYLSPSASLCNFSRARAWYLVCVCACALPSVWAHTYHLHKSHVKAQRDASTVVVPQTGIYARDICVCACACSCT